MTQPKKVLIATSHDFFRSEWMLGMQEDGVQLSNERKATYDEICRASLDADRYFVFNYGADQIFFVGGLSDAKELTREHRIDLAFIDSELDGDHFCGLSLNDKSTDDVIYHLLMKTESLVVSTAVDAAAHCDRLNDVCRVDGEIDAIASGRLIAGGREYMKNRTHLATLLGFRKAGGPVVKQQFGGQRCNEG